MMLYDTTTVKTSKDKRWKATATYRTDAGPRDVEVYVEELDELRRFIDSGPDWNCLETLVVVLNLVTSPGLTIEKSLLI